MKLVQLISIVIISGLPWWFIDYHTYTSIHVNTYLSFALVAICASVIFYKFQNKFWNVLILSIAAHQLALIIKVIIDILEDSSNHNLLPFEMIIYLFFDFIICFTSLFVVSKIKKCHLNKK